MKDKNLYRLLLLANIFVGIGGSGKLYMTVVLVVPMIKIEKLMYVSGSVVGISGSGKLYRLGVLNNCIALSFCCR